MITKTQYINRSVVALLFISLLCTACGATQIEPTSTLPPTLTSTPEPTPTIVPTPGPGLAFETDSVMEIPGLAKPVGQGSCKFRQADEAGMILITINGIMPVVDGKTCQCCVDLIDIGPNLRVYLSQFKSIDGSGRAAIGADMTLKDPVQEDGGNYILSGPDGAILKKIGSGFQLVSGLAYYVEE
jgi:hypothetical protein